MNFNSQESFEQWAEKRRERVTWQQRTSQQSRQARKGPELAFSGKAFVECLDNFTRRDSVGWALRARNAANHEDRRGDVMGDLLLREGVAIIYKSKLRYAAAHEDAITIDMFDAEVKLPEEFTSGASKISLVRRSEQFNTMMVLRDEIPPFLTAKMDTLYVALKSCQPERPSPSFVATIPGIGAAFATGAMWVRITKEDLDGA